VELKTITLDTDTTVHTLFGHQMGGRKSYNPKNRGKKRAKSAAAPTLPTQPVATGVTQMSIRLRCPTWFRSWS
jgi:hypothetical protein